MLEPCWCQVLELALGLLAIKYDERLDWMKFVCVISRQRDIQCKQLALRRSFINQSICRIRIPLSKFLQH